MSYMQCLRRYHFVLECRMLNDLRTKYIPSTHRTRPNMFKLIKLLTYTIENTARNLGIFINKAVVIRKPLFVFKALISRYVNRYDLSSLIYRDMFSLLQFQRNRISQYFGILFVNPYFL